MEICEGLAQGGVCKEELGQGGRPTATSKEVKDWTWNGRFRGGDEIVVVSRYGVVAEERLGALMDWRVVFGSCRPSQATQREKVGCFRRPGGVFFVASSLGVLFLWGSF